MQQSDLRDQVENVIYMLDQGTREKITRDYYINCPNWDEGAISMDELIDAICEDSVRDLILDYGMGKQVANMFAHIDAEYVIKAGEPDNPFLENVAWLVDLMYTTSWFYPEWADMPLVENGVTLYGLYSYLEQLCFDHDFDLDVLTYLAECVTRDQVPIIAKACHGDAQAEKQVIAMIKA